MDIGKAYLEVVLERFKDVKSLGDRTIRQLSSEDMHWKLNDASNSIAIIVKHISGNMQSRWTDFLTTDGEKTFRNRDQEFEEDLESKEVMMKVWEAGWQVLFDTLNGLTSHHLLQNITIRGEQLSVLEAIERQMAHYASHVGQIVYVAKQIKGDEWQTLSIAKGKSKEHLQEMLKKHQS